MGLVDNMRMSVYYRTKPVSWGYWSANAAPLNILGAQPGSSFHKHLERCSLSREEFSKNLEALKRKNWPPAVKVLIIGSDPSRRCAVFLSPEEEQGHQPIIRYYFPLKDRVLR